jgi:glycosyltransferase EpsE
MNPNQINKPDISVLMSVYKESANAIIGAVKSILNQTLTNFELIIVNDNPSSPETKEILDKLAKQDNRIRVLTNDKNRGLGYALNAAIKSSHADFIARMDTEDTSYPERLSKQLSYMKTNPKVDLLFTQWIDTDECGETVIRTPRRKDFANIKKYYFTKSLLMHPSLVAKKKIFLINPYPEMDRPEDIVLWLKLIRKDYLFDIIEEPLYTYRVDKINIAQRYTKIELYSKNLLPHLFRESRYYWSNIYFWFYFARIFFEYLISRNFLIFRITHKTAVQIWRLFFRN